MDNTVSPANNTMPSPDGATTDCGDNILFQLITHLLTPKGWKAELFLLAVRQRTVYPHKWSAVGWAQDSESSPVKDQRSTAAPRNQPINPCQPLTQKQNTVRRSNFLEWLPTWGVTVTATFRSQGQRSQDHCERKYEKIFSVHIFAKYIDDLHQYFRWQWRFGWWFGLVVTRWPRST